MSTVWSFPSTKVSQLDWRALRAPRYKLVFSGNSFAVRRGKVDKLVCHLLFKMLLKFFSFVLLSHHFPTAGEHLHRWCLILTNLPEKCAAYAFIISICWLPKTHFLYRYISHEACCNLCNSDINSHCFSFDIMTGCSVMSTRWWLGYEMEACDKWNCSWNTAMAEETQEVTCEMSLAFYFFNVCHSIQTSRFQ